MKHVPVLGGVLRGISVRAITRLVEDLQEAVKKVGGQAGRD